MCSVFGRRGPVVLACRPSRSGRDSRSMPDTAGDSMDADRWRSATLNLEDQDRYMAGEHRMTRVSAASVVIGSAARQMPAMILG